MAVEDATQGVHFDETVEYHHRPTEELDADGQGNCHTAFAFVAHRAVVDVDTELGLVKVVQVATAQDVGRALNPLSVPGADRGRHLPGPRSGRDGGDRPDRRPDPQRQLHRLPAADVPRHARRRRSRWSRSPTRRPRSAPRASASRRASRSRRPSPRRSATRSARPTTRPAPPAATSSASPSAPPTSPVADVRICQLLYQNDTFCRSGTRVGGAGHRRARRVGSAQWRVRPPSSGRS